MLVVSVSRKPTVVCTHHATILVACCSLTKCWLAPSLDSGYLARQLKIRQSTNDVSQKGTSVQQVYELCYCLWLLSFDCDLNEKIRNHMHRDGAVAALVDLVAAAPREKVVRLAIASLRNLAVCKADDPRIKDPMTKRVIDGSTFLFDMVGCGLMKSISLMKERDCSDPDLNDGEFCRVAFNVHC